MVLGIRLMADVMLSRRKPAQMVVIQ
jgi:hypothetical protein